MSIEKWVIGNWKMNGGLEQIDEIAAIASAVKQVDGVYSGLCIPATLIAPAVLKVAPFAIGAQDCHNEKKGAYTGNISAAMLVEAGARLCIVGHSERRQYQGEKDELVQAKARAASEQGMRTIICVGESEEVRGTGQAVSFVLEQVKASLPTDINPAMMAIAYEPIWAIGTGKVPVSGDIAEMHAAIQECLLQYGDGFASMNILYGGSMKASNADEILSIPYVGGGLIGGASLKADDFSPIVRAASL